MAMATDLELDTPDELAIRKGKLASNLAHGVVAFDPFFVLQEKERYHARSLGPNIFEPVQSDCKTNLLSGLSLHFLLDLRNYLWNSLAKQTIKEETDIHF